MATATPPTAPAPTPGPAAPRPPLIDVEPAPGLYSRASLKGDFMVMIAGQTVEQWMELRPPTQICEYLDGIIYMPSAPTPEHQDVALFLLDIINGFRYLRGGIGPVRFGPGDLQLSEARFPQPDVFVCPPEAGPGAPALLVIEVLSPSTRKHDLTVKAPMFREAGIPEFGFVDLDARWVKVERRRPDGDYSAEYLERGPWVVGSVPGLWIDVSWLWERPLPNPRACLDRVLAGPPG